MDDSKDGKKHSGVSKLTGYARQVITNLSGSSATDSQNQSEMPQEISNTLRIMRGPVAGAEAGHTFTNLLQNGARESQQHKSQLDEADKNDKSHRVDNQTQDLLTFPPTAHAKRPSPSIFGSSLSPLIAKTIKIFDIRRPVSERFDVVLPRSNPNLATDAPVSLTSGKITPGDFLKLATGSKRWFGGPSHSVSEEVPENNSEPHGRTRPQSPILTDVPPSLPREPRRPKRLILQNCQEDGGPMTPVYDLAEITPMLWTSPGIDADRVSKFNPLFVDAYERMDSGAGLKLKRLRRGLVPEASGAVSDWASSVVTERPVTGYNEGEVAALQDVLDTKRSLIARAEQTIDVLSYSNRKLEDRIAALKEEKELATYAAWNLKIKREEAEAALHRRLQQEEEQRQKAGKLADKTKSEDSAKRQTIKERVLGHVEQQVRDVDHQYGRSMEVLKWQQDLKDHHDFTIWELEKDIKETCNQVGKSNIEGVYKELFDPEQPFEFHKPTASDLENFNAPPEPESEPLRSQSQLQDDTQNMDSNDAVQVQVDPTRWVHVDEGIQMSDNEHEVIPRARAHFYSEDSDGDEGYVGGDIDYGHLGCRNGGYVGRESQEQESARVADRFLPQTTPYAGPSRYMASLSVQPKQSIFGPFKDEDDNQREQVAHSDVPQGHHAAVLHDTTDPHPKPESAPNRTDSQNRHVLGDADDDGVTKMMNKVYDQYLLDTVSRPQGPRPDTLEPHERMALWWKSNGIRNAVAQWKKVDPASRKYYPDETDVVRAAVQAYNEVHQKIKKRHAAKMHERTCVCDECMLLAQQKSPTCPHAAFCTCPGGLHDYLQSPGPMMQHSAAVGVVEGGDVTATRDQDQDVDQTTTADATAPPALNTTARTTQQQHRVAEDSPQQSSLPAAATAAAAEEGNYYETNVLDSYCEEDDKTEAASTQGTSNASAPASVENVEPAQDDEGMQLFLQDYIGASSDDE